MPTDTVALSAALNAQAATNAAIASAEADRAERAACQAVIVSYDSRTADVPRMQSYAQCVDRLYPIPDDGGISNHTAASIGLASLVIGALIVPAILRFKPRRRYEDAPDAAVYIVGSVAGAFCLPLVVFAIGLLVALVRYVFNV
ncbi:hypothetical protein Nazgul02 [Burkholderia phage BcepNazgul]|uniref:Uncharacterized protein n=1 Tax=Burkholderia phage BcepNazgul TaxID=242861 RepID=Q6UYG3_9CAUD|nr:hypothetical protein Nazgul02 [Burkholderia phage BcepNazgul]AAQ63378.1 hypothetical protein Nazgul02 [Burkholderia phage BcepNazgul]